MKNHRKNLIWVLMLALVIFNGSFTYAYWASGITGNQTDKSSIVPIGNWNPNIIIIDDGTPEQNGIDFVEAVQNSNSSTVIVLTEDVDIPGELTEPITPFAGTIDGGGNSISFNMSNSNGANLGLFTENEGTIKNLTIKDTTITSTGTNSPIIGFITPINSGTIENIIIEDSVSLTATITLSGNTAHNVQFGGIAGINESGSTIKNSHSNANATLNVTKTSGTGYSAIDSGGLVGTNNGIIENSYTGGTITANNTTRISAETYYGLGGLVGISAAGSQIINSYSTANVVANINDNSTATNYTGTLQANIGGLIGVMQASTSITNLYSTGSVTVNSKRRNNNEVNVGGLVGYMHENTTISQSFSEQPVFVTLINESNSTTTLKAGGLVGYAAASTVNINNSYSTSAVTAYAVREASSGIARAYAGGIIGEGTLSITNSYATGNISAYATNVSTGGTTTGGSGSRYTYTGGLAGTMSGTITRSFTAGNLATNTFNTTIAMGRVASSATTFTTTAHISNQSYTGYGSLPTNTSGTSRIESYLQGNNFSWGTVLWSYESGRYPLLVGTPKQ